MMRIHTMILFNRRPVLLSMLGLALLLSCQLQVNGQQKPPHPMTVYFNPAEGLRFGALYQSTSGGTVIISTSGLRTFTGSVIGADLGVAYGAANFEISSDPGTLVTIVNGPDATLYGSGGGTMTVHIGSSYPTSPLITTATLPAQTSVMVGGTLTVGSPVANPSGSYSGSFLVTFIQN